MPAAGRSRQTRLERTILGIFSPKPVAPYPFMGVLVQADRYGGALFWAGAKCKD